jgi:hypothetical protein
MAIPSPPCSKQRCSSAYTEASEILHNNFPLYRNVVDGIRSTPSGAFAGKGTLVWGARTLSGSRYAP